MRVGALVSRAFVGALAVLVCLGQAVETRQAPVSRLRAGAARIEITPKPGDLTIATDSIRDPLFARVVLVDDGSACAVLVGLDLGGASTALVTDAVARASAITGCPPDNFLVSATHTHSSSPQGLGQGAATAGMVADAIVEAARTAKAKLAPARVGYGHTNVDLNVNRDLFNSKLEWRQEPNPAGSSDKTLAVVEVLGADNVPIAVYMNYAMHPINFYLSGVISADFPGRHLDTSRSCSTTGPSPSSVRARPAIRTRATSDRRRRSWASAPRCRRDTARSSRRSAYRRLPPAPCRKASTRSRRRRNAARSPPRTWTRTRRPSNGPASTVHMLGAMLGSSAVRVMRESIEPVDNARIWAGHQSFACPGRVRNDADNPARENVFPGYKDGPDVNLKVGVLRIGDVHFVGVNGEVYSQIGMRIKAEAPASKTIVVTLANGSANSGYIYSDEAFSHLTFQVIGSRLKPGCAESKIVSTAVSLMRRAGEPLK